MPTSHGPATETHRKTSEPEVRNRKASLKPSARELLELYLHDHLAAAAGGRDLVARIAKGVRGSVLESPITQLQAEIEEDRATVREITSVLGFDPRAPLKSLVASVGEKLGRLKLNKRLVRRSPLSLVLELEGLQSAVDGKRALWQTLLELSAVEPVLTQFELPSLLARADSQLERVRELHDRAVRHAFVGEPRTAKTSTSLAEAART